MAASRPLRLRQRTAARRDADHKLAAAGWSAKPPSDAVQSASRGTVIDHVPDWKKLLDSAVSQVSEGTKAAKEGLLEATEGARKVAADAGKVAGIGVGDIAITVAGPAYMGGEIRGTIALQLPEPVAAERLSIALRARRARIPIENLRKRNATPLQTEDVFDFAVDVDGDRTYETGEHTFAIDIPEDPPEPEVPGFLGDALKAARAFQSMTQSELRWRLVATLHLPWKRNLTKTIDVVVRDASQRPAPPPPPPRKPREPPPIPHPVSLPAGWGEALAACLKQIKRSGGVVIHQFVAPPVQPSTVAEILRRAPDLPPDILMWYGLMDGLELVVGVPRTAKSSYDSVRLARAQSEKLGGAIGCLDELGSRELTPALDEEFEDGLTILEIPNLTRMLDEDTEDFPHRDNKSVIFGHLTVGYGAYFGLTRAEEIRRWRQPKPGQSGRDDYFDHVAEPYQAALKQRTRDFDDAWWVVRGEDHGGLALPAQLLRWPEMLTWGLEHLVRGVSGRARQ